MLHEWLLGHMSEKNYQVVVTSPSEYGDALLKFFTDSKEGV